MTELYLLATTDDKGGELDPVAVFRTRESAEAYAQVLEDQAAVTVDRLPKHLTWTDPDDSPWQESTSAMWTEPGLWDAGFYLVMTMPLEPAVASPAKT